MFGVDAFPVSWSTVALAEATFGSDYADLSELVLVPFGAFEAQAGRFVFRTTLPGIPVLAEETDEAYERFLVELKSAPGTDSRIGFVRREDIKGFAPTLSGSGFLNGVVTIRGQDGGLRLVDGDAGHEGRLEIFLHDQWGTICDDYWSDLESDVACRQLGYPAAESKTRRFLRAHFGKGTGPIWLDNVLCYGGEILLTDCPREDEGAEIGRHNCTHAEDVGVRCRPANGATAVRLANGAASREYAWPAAEDPTAVESLDVVSRGGIDLGGLAAFTGLERLNLSDNAVSDLSALAGLTRLTRLDLSSNAIEHIGPLAALVELRVLNLAGNRVADLGPLAALPYLEVLILDGNAVRDVGPLTHLRHLRYLVLAGNDVEDITPLAELAALERLDLFGNPVVDLSPLDILGGLVWLRLPTDADASAASIPADQTGR